MTPFYESQKPFSNKQLLNSGRGPSQMQFCNKLNQLTSYWASLRMDPVNVFLNPVVAAASSFTTGYKKLGHLRIFSWRPIIIKHETLY